MPTGEELTEERRAKRDRLASQGVPVYPHSFPGRVSCLSVREELQGTPSGGELGSVRRTVAGRVRSVRDLGKSAFVPLGDESGEIQLMLSADRMGEPTFTLAMGWLDPGDLVGAEGTPLVSRRGEPSLGVKTLTLLAKALRVPPEKYHGLRDVEARLRQRYIDLLASRATLERFRARTYLVRALRHFLDAEGFLEVETPILERVASGASARPFVTHYRFLDEDLKLRIALELRLKRLLVGGFERVYEIGKVFRNEDLDSTHSPEFTMLEAYWAYADYHDLRSLVERMLFGLASEMTPYLPKGSGDRVRSLFTPPFDRIDFVEALEKESGLSDLLDLGPEILREKARAVGADVQPGSTVGYCLDKLFDHYVTPKLERPTFVMDHPAVTTPLAKRHRSLPGRVERFELFVHGYELGNAYTELNDPDEQLRRFEEQRTEKGEESYALDEDFLEAMRYGMPPMTGVGLGVDRLAMALLDTTSIKEVVLFPATKRPGPPGPGGAPPGAGSD